MPVTFADPPTQGRRLSASTPFPGRVMTSLVPADVPSRQKRRGSSSSGRRAHNAAGSYTGASGPGPVPEDPFAEDESGVARAAGASTISVRSTQEYERMTPEAAAAAAPGIYSSNGDAERQPLLHGVRDEEEEEDERYEVPCAFTFAIAAAIGIATFVILYVWRISEVEGAIASA